MADSPTDDDRGDSFLGRSSWGLSHYLWIALAVTLALGFIPRGVRKTLEGNTNKAEDWLPASYAESKDLVWFRDHFAGEAFVLVSWDGCKLRDEQQLDALEAALAAETDKDGGWAWYPRIRTGPSTIRDLVDGPANLTRSQAIKRLEGALVGPAVEGDDGSRTTCLLAYLDDRLTDNNLQMRRAVERVRDITADTVGVPVEAIHLGGPPVDNITIDIEGERTLLRLAWLSGIVGITLAYLCFRSEKLTAMVFWTAGASAGMSLALVYWFGGFETLLMGLDEPRLGKADAILMSMPAVVYVLALSGAIHLVNYYRDERLEHGPWGAAERAVRVAWGPCLLAAFTTAVGLGSLGASDILPIQKFGIFSAIGVLVAVALLFAIMPVFLFRFPPDRKVVEDRAEKLAKKTGRAWYEPLALFTTHRYGITTALCLAVMATVAVGLTKTRTSVQLLGLLDDSCRLITDYEWFESNLGNLVPMEVIVALDQEQLRTPDDPAVADDGARYRMTMYERSELIKQLQAEIESLPEISRALSAATFAGEPQDSGGSASMRRSAEFAASELLEQSRDSLGEYLRFEELDGAPTGRELWRVSARVTALGEVDYGQFVTALRAKVEPVLDTYRRRDQLFGQLDGAEDKASVVLLVDAYDPARPGSAPADSDEARLADLLAASRGVRHLVYSVDDFFASDEARRDLVAGSLRGRDLVAAIDPSVAQRLSEAVKDLNIEVLALDPAPEEPLPATEALATYTGVVPVVYKTQRELLTSLRESILWATVLIAGVMVFVLRSPAAGIASMIPNVFPIVMVFGALGWIGFKVDIGTMMTASVALGVAVDDTLHFVTWFSRGIREGLDRRSAVLLAYERCATAMTQTTLIGGLGLAVFAVSTFTPTQQFGCLMITMLATALVGDLVLLPALLCGPLGRFFAPGSPARPPEEPTAGGDGASQDESPLTDQPELVDPEASVAAAPPQPATEPDPEPTPEPGDEEAEEPATIPFAAAPPEPKPPKREPLSPANEALRSKLRSFRRPV